MEYKIIRDPIHNYIKIPLEFFEFIDSAEFQRLRYISQTSYSGLFPGATHNRFLHSLGVFHLGNIAINSLFNNAKKKIEEVFSITEENLFVYKKTFLTACLLHDFGHLPFSHTGEMALSIDEINKMRGTLKKIFNDSDFLDKIFKKSSYHEPISVILAIQKFRDIFNKNKISEIFFARLITGCLHDTSQEETTKQFENILINLLNSNLIDVDKLDYIMRDAGSTGYEGVRLDIERLLSSLTIVLDEGPPSRYNLGYKKSAISILENVITANNWERKWVQSHPTIIYENKIIEKIIELYNSCIESKFTVESLSEPYLLTDNDIICFAKEQANKSINSDEELFVKELFNRSIRRKPLWKTESDYNYLLKNNNQNFIKKLQSLVTIGDKTFTVINDKTKHIIQEQIDNIDSIARKEELKKAKKIIEKLEDFFDENHHTFDFALIFRKFSKQTLSNDVGKLLIEDKDSKHVCALEEYLPKLVFSYSSDNSNESMFYVYVNKHDNKESTITASNFIKKLKEII